MKIPAFVLAFILASTAQAEVLMIDVTIKSIDPQDRLITVTKTSKTASKDLELEVARKAEIFVEGKEAPLDSVKPGQSASISYETELELVTKIDVFNEKSSTPLMSGGRSTASPAQADTPAEIISAVSIKVNDDGLCKLIIDSRKKEDAHEKIASQAQSYKIKRIFDEAELSNQEDGRIRVIHDFSKLKNANSLRPASFPDSGNESQFNALRVNPGRGSLILPPHQGGGGSVWCSTHYPKTLFGDTEINILFDEISLDQVKELRIACWYGKSSCDIIIYGQNARHMKGQGEISIIENANVINYDAKTVFSGRQMSDQQSEFEFNLTPEAHRRKRLSISASSDSSIAIHRIDITSKFPPRPGIGLAGVDGKINVSRVLPGDAMEKAGVRAGDVILSINGEKPESVHAAYDLLGEIGFDDKIQLKFERMGKERTIVVNPVW